MGLIINSLAEIPENVSRSYYLYILDYHNWNEPIGNTLRENYNKLTSFAAQNDSVIITGVDGSHVYNEFMSWQTVNGIDTSELSPAIMITTLHPSYFYNNTEDKKTPKDKFVFLKIRDICEQPQDVVSLLEKLFNDIKEKKEIKDFQIVKEVKGGIGKVLNDALILEPTIGGIGVDLKKVFNFIRIQK
jgi:hypothetical protein